MDRVQVFVNVDEEGIITETYIGENVVATEQYSFFFLKSAEIAENIGDYKVVVEGFKHELVLK